MIKTCCYVLLVAFILLVALDFTLSAGPTRRTLSNHGIPRRNLEDQYNSHVIEEDDEVNKKEDMNLMRRRADTFRIAGSRLPDCSHACGSCSPCHLVMVHLGCTNSLAQPETCPMAYKCLCSNKPYPVP